MEFDSESASLGAGRRSLRGVDSGEARMAVKSRSRLRFKAGLAGGRSASRIASLALVVEKVPATALAMVAVSLSKPLRSHGCPVQMASTP